MILIDTSVFVDVFRNFKPAVEFFSNLDYDTILVSTMTETELLAGSYCNNQEYRERTLHLLNRCKEVVTDKRVAILAGDIKRKFKLAVPDAIIAASAMENNATLITSNIKHFEKVPLLKVKKPY